MKLHREGKIYILVSSFLWIAATGLMFLFSEDLFLNLLVSAFFFFFFVVFVQFFRVPAREFAIIDDSVIAPCDGKVVVIEKVLETEFLNREAIQVSIFMSPVNVHVNWYPVSGVVRYVKYHPGKYLVAWHPKSSTENERSTVVVERADGRQVLVRQIAGILARKICTYARENMPAKQGAEMGFIKFGSRVDIFLPPDTIIDAKLGDVTKGGITKIATLPAADEATV